MTNLTQTFYRLCQSYTCLNFVLIFMSFFLPCLKNIANANTLLIAIATSQTFFFISFPILVQYYQSLFPFLSKGSVLIVHILLHYLPLLWMNCKNMNITNVSIALLFFGWWYLMVRNKIKKIYSDKISLQKYDTIISSSSLLYMLIVVIFNLCSYGCA